MNLDVQALLIVMMIDTIALPVAMPAIMGWRVSRAARCAQGSVVPQTLGWSALGLSGQFFDKPLSVLAMAGLAVGQGLRWEATHGWLGPRPGRALVWGLALLMPLGYGLGFENYLLRVGWANAGLALQMACVCVALAWPAPQASRRWRLLIGRCLAAMAVATTWRGVLGAFFTDSSHLQGAAPGQRGRRTGRQAEPAAHRDGHAGGLARGGRTRARPAPTA